MREDSSLLPRRRVEWTGSVVDVFSGTAPAWVYAPPPPAHDSAADRIESAMRTHRSAFAHACAPAQCSGIARTLGACRPARIWAEDRASTAVTAQDTRPDAYVCIALLSYAVRCGMGSYAPPEHAGRKHFAGHKPKLLPPATQQARAGRRRRPPRRRCGASRRLRALQRVGRRSGTGE